MAKYPWLWFILFQGAAIGLASFAPLEKTLGVNARLVYFHGAWVWTAMLAFLLAGIFGAAGLGLHRDRLHIWSQAWGWTGLCFWLVFLPMSLYVMQVNWNGIYLDEPRFRVPLNLAIAGLLLQVGFIFFRRPVWTSLGNLLFGAALIWIMNKVGAVLHPDSPILNSQVGQIQRFFVGLLFLLVLAAWQMTVGWAKKGQD